MSEECEACEECEEGLPAYLATFADLMSLLMCFFVLLLSFSEMDLQKYKQVAGSMKLAFGVQREIEAVAIPKGTSIIKQEYSPGVPKPTIIKTIRQDTVDDVKENLKVLDAPNQEVEEAVSMLLELTEDEIRNGEMEIQLDDDQILIRINEQGSFDSGSAKLKKSFYPVLKKIVQALDKTQGDIIVSGHTDNVPIHTPLYPSNWVLSAARAASVVHHMTEWGLTDPGRVQIRAYGEYRPLVPNDTSRHRARNRRVEISIDTSAMTDDQDAAQAADGQDAPAAQTEQKKNESA